MKWFSLRIGQHNLRIAKLSKERGLDLLPYCSSEGKEVERKQTARAEYKTFEVETGKEYVGRLYRMIKGKPMDKLPKTKEVSVYTEVDNKEVADLRIEDIYLAEGDILLYEKLMKEKKAYKFAFSNGNGFKVYIAYLVAEKGNLMLYLGWGFKSQLIDEMRTTTETTTNKLFVDNVERATAESLMV